MSLNKKGMQLASFGLPMHEKNALSIQKPTEDKSKGKIFNLSRLQLLLDSGESYLYSGLSIQEKPKQWLYDKLESSFIVIGYNKDGKVILEKNTNSYLMSFLKIFNIARNQYLNKKEVDVLAPIYPYGNTPLNKILEPNIVRLIKLEKKLYADLPIADKENIYSFYLEATSIICESLGLADPITIMSYESNLETVH